MARYGTPQAAVSLMPTVSMPQPPAAKRVAEPIEPLAFRQRLRKITTARY